MTDNNPSNCIPLAGENVVSSSQLIPKSASDQKEERLDMRSIVPLWSLMGALGGQSLFSCTRLKIGQKSQTKQRIWGRIGLPLRRTGSFAGECDGTRSAWRAFRSFCSAAAFFSCQMVGEMRHAQVLPPMRLTAKNKKKYHGGKATNFSLIQVIYDVYVGYVLHSKAKVKNK